MESILINRQSSIRISGEKTVYFDPWDVTGFTADADVIFITHDHFDHYVAADIIDLKRNDTVVVVPAGMARQVREETGANILAVEPGKAYTANGVDFETVAAYNINKEFHPKESGFCGYVVTFNAKRWYITGDTDVTPEAEETRCDVLLLPIGGYYTMDYKEAASLATRISPELVIPTHYGDVIGEKSFGEEFKKLMQDMAPEARVQLVLYQYHS